MLWETPIHKIYDDENRVYFKRDDLLGFSFGGNKLRIALEYFNDMQNKKANHIVSYGPAQSNLNRVISNLAFSKNIPCTIISTDNSMDSYNAKLCKAFGANIVYCSKSNVAGAVTNTMSTLKSKGYVPYYIYGNSRGRGNEHTPISAYAKVYAEILKQEQYLKLKFDYIYIACGTGTSLAGLACGNISNSLQHNIIGISVARDSFTASEYINSYIENYLYKNNNLVYNRSVFNKNAYTIIDDYKLEYAKSNSEIKATAFNVLSNYGIALDPIYTAKAFWGMREHIKSNCIENKNILFIHTGGAPLFFDNLKDVLKEQVNG